MSASPPAAASNWVVLAVTLAIQSMGTMSLITLPVMAPEVARALGVSPALVGVYVSIVYLGAVVATVLGGTLVARWGAIRVSQWCLVVCLAGLLLCAVPWMPAVAVGAVLIGLGYGPITPASSHLLAITTPAHRMALVFSLKQTGVPLGSLLAGAIVPSLMLLTGWQASLALVGLACLAIAACSQPLRAALDADRQPDARINARALIDPVRLVLGHGALRALALCSLLFSVVQMSTTSYLVTYLHEDLAFDLVMAGLLLSIAQAGGVIGRITWGLVADRWLGARRMLLVLAIMMAATSLATAMITPQTPRLLLMVLLVLSGAGAIGWNGVYLAEVARRAPAGSASLATGGTLGFTFSGVVLGPPLFGLVAALAGAYRAGFLMLVLAAAASAWVLVASASRARSA